MKERPADRAADEQLEKMYDTNYVAELFGVTNETVRAWIERGELEAVRVSRRWRIPRRALVAFANSKYGAA